MSRRIVYLNESPCYQCGCEYECNEKIERNPKIGEIQDAVFGNADFDYHNCGIWIALNTPGMIEVDE